ncbi:ankyrin repeat domain-containing protein [Sedimenticola hydrogenitrophicus]|uniref:ankyrin repeat domain-containing protein n=1 Tax=Sedimenticola hydrogenitrophicus TaxID=2967975 RepID=UPI003B589D1F
MVGRLGGDCDRFHRVAAGPRGRRDGNRHPEPGLRERPLLRHGPPALHIGPEHEDYQRRKGVPMSLERDLLRAARQGKTGMVITLLREGADINVATDDGQTPLHHAAAGGHTDTAIALMKRGARPHPRDEANRTPLNTAMRNGHIETAHALREEIALQQALRAELRSIMKRRQT